MNNQTENKIKPIQISDLLDVIHYTIIKQKGENNIVLKELESIDKKIKSGELENYPVNETTYWKHLASLAAIDLNRQMEKVDKEREEKVKFNFNGTKHEDGLKQIALLGLEVGQTVLVKLNKNGNEFEASVNKIEEKYFKNGQGVTIVDSSNGRIFCVHPTDIIKITKL